MQAESGIKIDAPPQLSARACLCHKECLHKSCPAHGSEWEWMLWPASWGAGVALSSISEPRPQSVASDILSPWNVEEWRRSVSPGERKRARASP